MDEGNYIKLKRSILDWQWYANINTRCLFIHMLLKANWKDGWFEGKQILRGSFVSSYPKLASECGLTVNELRTALKHLTDTGEVTVKAHARYSVFTIKNYCEHQGVNTQITDKSQTINTQITDKSQTINTQITDKSQPINSLLTTIEEGKKERREEIKEKENKKEKYFDSEKLNNTFLDFIAMRKKMKAPMTDRAIDLAIGKLKKYSEIPFSDGEINEDVAIEILNNSIMNSWKGLFPLKEKRKLEESKPSNFEEMWRDA